jgi:hypothetical protein
LFDLKHEAFGTEVASVYREDKIFAGYSELIYLLIPWSRYLLEKLTGL